MRKILLHGDFILWKGLCVVNILFIMKIHRKTQPNAVSDAEPHYPLVQTAPFHYFLVHLPLHDPIALLLQCTLQEEHSLLTSW